MLVVLPETPHKEPDINAHNKSCRKRKASARIVEGAILRGENGTRLQFIRLRC
jgi:hypothetical protein